MSESLLQVSGLVTAYGKIDVLKDVSLGVAEGSVTCLLGPNGAGKTTLMSTLAGLLRPRRGTIRFAGHDLTGRPPHEAVAHGIALVAQNRRVFQNLSVHENLWAGAHSRKDRREIEADLARLYERFPLLGQRQTQRAGSLSGGEQQMLAVARALMSRPRIVLLDEPSLGLAPLIVEHLFSMIGDISAAGTTVFLVEQNIRMALKTAQHVYLMERGRVTFSGDPAQLAEDPLIQRAYLSRPRHDPAYAQYRKA